MKTEALRIAIDLYKAQKVINPELVPDKALKDAWIAHPNGGFWTRDGHPIGMSIYD